MAAERGQRGGRCGADRGRSRPAVAAEGPNATAAARPVRLAHLGGGRRVGRRRPAPAARPGAAVPGETRALPAGARRVAGVDIAGEVVARGRAGPGPGARPVAGTALPARAEPGVRPARLSAPDWPARWRPAAGGARVPVAPARSGPRLGQRTNGGQDTQ